jgi:hypothetical protein
MAAGESYEMTNKREVEEEMCIRDVHMQQLFTFFYEDSLSRCWGDAWECEYDGPIKMQKVGTSMCVCVCVLVLIVLLHYFYILQINVLVCADKLYPIHYLCETDM